MAVFLGLDLAWTPHHESGICAFDEGGRVLALETRVATPEQLADSACSFGDDVVVAVDAPLIVTPLRSAEREVARAFSRFRASPHQVNLGLLRSTNRMAGPNLYRCLAERGFQCEPTLVRPRTTGWHVMEVYPHAAHVRLFELPERLTYKRKNGRTVDFVRVHMRRYQDFLRFLIADELPALVAEPAIQSLLAPGSVHRRGRSLKQLEDMLDALTCAWVARHAWLHGTEGIEVFGDEHGHVVVPRGRAATSALGPTSPSGPGSGPATPSPPGRVAAAPAFASDRP